MGTKISISGLDALISQLSAVEQRALSKDMLKAAEPYLQKAMDAEMQSHPGPTADSLRSTGARDTSKKGYYLAYRATDSEAGSTSKSKNERTPTEKIFYLMTRQYISTRNGAKLKKPYVIPAYPVAAAAVAASEGQIVEIMQQIFEKKITDSWGKR